jgi:glutaminyl-peptide cyclotransferase
MTSKTLHVYEIADDDDSAMPGSKASDLRVTAAGIAEDDDVEGGFAEPPPGARGGLFHGPLCIAAIVLLSLVIAGSAAAVIVVSRRGGSDNSSATDAGEPAGSDVPLPVVVSEKAPTFQVKVVRSTPHDANAFLQGFEYDAARGQFFESTGLRGGRSSLRRVDIATGRVLQTVSLPDPQLFGEGMTLHKDKHILMLTWQAEKGFVFNQSTFEIIREWNYTGEGWGLTMDRDADEVYMSDGTDELRVLDPDTLEEKRRISVTLDGAPVVRMNEIEWICGEVWANLWMENRIVRVNPSTGIVRSVVQVGGLPFASDVKTKPDVLNGIAYDEKTGRLWISGKLWPKVYEVTVTDDSFAKQCGLR